MTPEKRKLLELKLEHAIAQKQAYIATANKELANGGWLCDWEVAFNQTHIEANEIIAELETYTP